jgi:hypothetical protein
MAKRLLILAAFIAISSCFSETAQAQYGGVQVRVGGYGTGVQIGGFGYGNGIYSNYGYGNAYGNGYRNIYGNGYRNIYGNGYQVGHGNYQQPSANYLLGDSFGGLGPRTYPTMIYGTGTPRYYAVPLRRYAFRRFR